MTKAQFITAIEAKPRFIKWAALPALTTTIGEIEQWTGKAYVSTPDGNYVDGVSFFVDKATGEATWVGSNQIDSDSNALAKKYNVLKGYLASNFVAYFIGRTNLEDNWVEADVYTVSGTDLAKSTVLVYKAGANPITHKKIV